MHALLRTYAYTIKHTKNMNIPIAQAVEHGTSNHGFDTQRKAKTYRNVYYIPYKLNVSLFGLKHLPNA